MKKFLDKIEARDLLNNSYDEFTIVQNPDYVYPEYEVVPLAKQLFLPLNNTMVLAPGWTLPASSAAIPTEPPPSMTTCSLK